MQALKLTMISLLVAASSLCAQDSVSDTTLIDPVAAPPPEAIAADTTKLQPQKPPPVMGLTIEHITISDMRLNDTLDVLLNSGGTAIGGFDLKLAVNDPDIDIVDILPGHFYDSCGWEYFNARRFETTGRESFPRLTWSAVGLSQLIPDSVRPDCFVIEGEMSILRLIVSNEHVRETDDKLVPIYFFWEDCSDNTISDKSGNQLLISRRVYDYSGAQPDSSARTFPSRTGALTQCIDPSAHNPMRRGIDFHNGLIEFKLDLSLPDTSGTGPVGTE